MKMLLKRFVLLLLVFLDYGKTEQTIVLEKLINNVFPITTITKTIRNNLLGLDDAEITVLKMIDASTKVPSGLLNGNFFDLGDFEECYGINNKNIYGKYCLGTYALSDINSGNLILKFNTSQRNHEYLHPQPRLLELGPTYLGIHIAACVPHTLKAEKIQGLVRFTEEFCYSKATEQSLSTGSIITIGLLSFFALIIFLSTCYDAISYYNREKPRHDLFIAFSFLSNGRKIFSSTANPDQMSCLNGIKAISMMWVIIGHEYLCALDAPLANFFDVDTWRNDPWSMFINGATVSVDSFFAIGGLVTVYTFLKTRARGIKFNIISFYIHRYLRLTPALGITILVYTYLLEYMGRGPLWKIINMTLVQTCKKSWWSTLLYITNYIEKYSCAPQTWYLSVDMQLFVLSPLVLIPLARWPKYGLSLLGGLTIAGIIIPFTIGYQHNLNFINSLPYMEQYYIQTYTRFGPYVIGMISGYYIYQVKYNSWPLKLSWKEVLLSWAVCLAGLLCCLYAGFNLFTTNISDKLSNGFYLGFNRQAWSVALCGVIILCVGGYGGPINAFLSHPVFQFLTKISYSMYLVHYAVINVRYSSMKETFRFSNIQIMHIFWADFMTTLFLSLILCLSFESPIIILEKFLFGKHNPKVKEKKKEAI